MTTTTHVYGKDVLIKIGAVGAGSFTVVGGQTTISKKATSDKIDFSSKDDGSIKAMGFGQQEISFSLAGKVKLPDAGFAALQTASKAIPPECDIQIVHGSATIYAGTVGVGNFSWDAANNGPVNYSADLSAVAVPTTDDLTATGS